ncbi:unnamed protein product [Chilo suppressalis]|uniref:FP protein C-terminal domain-containing protein n=1 Tax=Chilo suppressalis TaxID=168631 RepID=A0ABN8AXX8_CHISP|nr:unnamed protein product [Chilo suppressalis]
MPLKRTPPLSKSKTILEPTASSSCGDSDNGKSPYITRSPSPLEFTSSNLTLRHCESVPALAQLHEEKVKRNKRKFEGHDHSDMRSFMAEMRLQFSTFTDNQDKQLRVLQESITSIKEQNSDIFKSIEFISKKYDEITVKLQKIEKERENNLNYIMSLEDKIDFMEKKSRATYLEIRNIPRSDKETKDNLCLILVKIAKTLNITLDMRDIRDIYRINNSNSENKHRPIIVELGSVILKNNFLSAIKKFNKVKGAEKLNTQHINMEGSPNFIYISESLTQKLKRLFYLSREFAKANDYNYCWTANGNVYLRKQEGAAHIRINSEADLDKILETK